MDSFDSLFQCEIWQIEMIERLKDTSVYKNDIIEINELTYDEANEYIKKLYNGQIDPIKSGLNYSQTDIKREIYRILNENK